MKNNSKYETIFVLVNQGFTDAVMEAAISKGARGGTIINARGGSDKEASKNYGVVITPDKELMLILVESKIKEAVIKEIHHVAGIETKAMAIIGSIPADNVIGFAKNSNDKAKIDKKAKKQPKKSKK